ncbi:hypothetical protein [Pseudoalteromonas holothuriae]|uniref:hypothetical protein n=1 Tax=Pseudoalteromonas holothuriae TaxID=2963714 RepID=UPI0021C22007|nr:hypothetical protein [Pseudoalteromonas sp. CIP111951]
MNKAMPDFVSTALLVGVVLALTKSALPTVFLFDGVAGINPLILTLMLLINGVLASAIFYFISSIPIFLCSARMASRELFFQCIRTFSIFNLILPVLVLIALNRIAINLDLKVATSDFDLWFGGLVGLAGFLVTYRVLGSFTFRYFQSLFGKRIAMVVALLSIVLTSYLNPGSSLSYFKHLVDTGKFCEALVEKKYQKQIIDGSVDYDQMIFQCKYTWGNKPDS